MNWSETEVQHSVVALFYTVYNVARTRVGQRAWYKTFTPDMHAEHVGARRSSGARPLWALLLLERRSALTADDLRVYAAQNVKNMFWETMELLWDYK